MMALRFGWIGQTRRASLRRSIADVVRAWLADWCVQPEPAPEIVEAPIMPLPPDEACVLQVDAAHPRTLAAVSRDDLAPLGNWLAGVTAGKAALAADVGRAAVEDLACRIAGLAGRTVVVEHGGEAWPLSLTREELGAVGLMLTVADVGITLTFAREVVDALCPPAAVGSGKALQPRAEATGPAPVRLKAVLDLGPIAMRELAQLRAGEVLVGECPLDTPVRLLAPGPVCLGHAHIGRAAGHLAVAITPHPEQENV